MCYICYSCQRKNDEQEVQICHFNSMSLHACIVKEEVKPCFQERNGLKEGMMIDLDVPQISTPL